MFDWFVFVVFMVGVKDMVRLCGVFRLLKYWIVVVEGVIVLLLIVVFVGRLKLILIWVVGWV